VSTLPPISANVITAARLPLAPLAVICLMTHHPAGTVAAAALALVLELTDILDGKIARSYGQVSDFGKLFDPFSDAATRFTLFLGLYEVGVADLWMILVIFYRDSSISFLRSVAAVRRVVLAARQSGKIKAIVQGVGTQLVFLCLALFDLAPGVPIPPQTPWWIMLAMTVVTAWSWVDYFAGNQEIVRAAWNDAPVDGGGKG
jgi:CDP-diacylglycerol--glycerol-3-phosphate 3-phosphatidyltransferase